MWRVVRVVEGAALEMLCPERDLGFESLTLRQKKSHPIRGGFSFYRQWRMKNPRKGRRAVFSQVLRAETADYCYRGAKPGF